MPYSDMLIRPAQPADAMAVAGVHVPSWQAACRNILPDDYLELAAAALRNRLRRTNARRDHA